jgi:hypothetical protein
MISNFSLKEKKKPHYEVQQKVGSIYIKWFVEHNITYYTYFFYFFFYLNN